MLGLGYPGGPEVAARAEHGDSGRFDFPRPMTDRPGLDFSFSGLKTSILYFLEREKARDPGFAEKELAHICASIQHAIVTILMQKLRLAAEQTGISHIAIGGGVAANSGIRNALKQAEADLGWITYIPPFQYCTDNAGMIGIVGYLKYLEGRFTDLGVSARARYRIGG